MREGDIVFCWPERFDPAEGAKLEGADGKPALRCVGIICGIADGEVAVHYFLPDGANGAQRFPRAPEALTRGRWWSRDA